MHDVIFPRHYEYRIVRCKVSNIAVWSHLSIHRGLAQNVRRLEILDERSADSSLIPSDILTTDTELESSDDELTMHDKQGRLFGTALSKLSSLNEFVWSCNHSLISLCPHSSNVVRSNLSKSMTIWYSDRSQVTTSRQNRSALYVLVSEWLIDLTKSALSCLCYLASPCVPLRRATDKTRMLR